MIQVTFDPKPFDDVSLVGILSDETIKSMQESEDAHFQTRLEVMCLNCDDDKEDHVPMPDGRLKCPFDHSYYLGIYS